MTRTDIRQPTSPVGPLLDERSRWLRYTTAPVLVGVIAGLRVTSAEFMGVQAPLLPFALAVFAAAHLAGFGPALLATVLAPIAATVLFANLSSPGLALQWVGHVTLFVTIACLVSIMMRRLQLAYRAQCVALEVARSAAEQTRLVTDALPVLIAYCDREHRYRFNNKFYRQWFGRSSIDLTGAHVKEVLGIESYKAVEPYIARALAGESVEFETAIPTPEGTRQVSAHYVPDKSTDGEVRGWFALIQDITDRKRAEQALADERLSLALALRVGRSGTYAWDIQGNHNVWSNELLELYGLAPEEFDCTHEGWLNHVLPADLPRVLELGQQALKDGEAAFDFRIRRRKTGEVRWLHARNKVFYDESGKPLRMLGVNIDVTEQKVAEQRLRDADRRKDEFLAMLAHELRNPLSPIRNTAHVLADTKADEQTMRRCGELLERQVGNLARLVDDLLDVARIRQGRIEIKRQNISVQTVIERAIETLSTTLHAKNQIVDFLPARTPLFVHGDPVRLEQVFVNLLANAAKFSAEHSLITVRMTRVDSSAVVRVRDQGIGIDPQNLPHIFDLFMQADGSLDRSQGGLGIGLTLVKRIVELHGGSVEAQSRGLGTGTEFIVTLPNGIDPAVPEPKPPERQTASPPRRVLIIEDSPDSAESLAIVLRLNNHDVRVSHSGSEALRLLESFAPQFIFSDIGLPGIDGFALAELLRRHRNGKTARIYAITGYGRAGDKELSHSSGFDGHLTKSVEPEVVLRLLTQNGTRPVSSPPEPQNSDKLR